MLNKLDMEFEDKFEYKSFVVVPLKNKLLQKIFEKPLKWLLMILKNKLYVY